MPFEFSNLEINGAKLIKPHVFEDPRGSFVKWYEIREFDKNGIDFHMVESMYSVSVKNTLRGFHVQREPYPQAKLMRCTKGRVFDVMLDTRRGSKTFGKHIALELSEANRNVIYVPRGVANSFFVLSDVAEVSYAADNLYMPDYEAGVIWNDPALNIKWPGKSPIISEKDKKWPTLKEL